MKPRISLSAVPMLIVAVVLLSTWIGFYSRPEEKAPVYGQLPEFRFTNQLNQPITRDSLEGKIWISDLIFTRCAGPCPVLTKHLRKLQDTYAKQTQIGFITLTADPAFDTPSILNSYKNRYAAGPSTWHFLTGAKTDLHQFVTQELKLADVEPDPDSQANGADQFIHSTRIVLLDGKGQIRGYFDGLSQDDAKLSAAIDSLLKEIRSNRS